MKLLFFCHPDYNYFLKNHINKLAFDMHFQHPKHLFSNIVFKLQIIYGISFYVIKHYKENLRLCSDIQQAEKIKEFYQNLVL